MDADLAAQVDRYLDDEEASVLLAFRVTKHQAGWNLAGRRGRAQNKPRVLAITAKRDPATQKYNVRIHVIKTSQQGLLTADGKKSYKLSTLTSIEAERSDTTGRSFYLVYDMKKDASLPQWAVRTIDERNQLLVCLLKMSRENLGRMPKVVGIDVVELALWAQKTAKPLAIGSSSSPAFNGQREEGAVSATDTMAVQQDLVSKVEEEDMEVLLGTYVIGIDEAEAFSERLKRELAALEAANVHAILESENLVEEVLERLDGAARSVDLMEDHLSVFNTKLKHMREDIESIELANNRLKVQSENSEALLGELEKLLECLHVPEEHAEVLTESEFDEASMPEILEACDWLCDTLETLEPAESENFSKMRAIREKRKELERLKETFVRQATDFLRNYFAQSVEIMITERKALIKGYPDHKELRRKFRVYERLLEQMKVLSYSSLVDVRKSYCKSLNLLLRRETREFAGELKANARLPKASLGRTENASGTAISVAQASGDTSGASDAYARMLKTFIPMLADEASYFADYMRFEVRPPDSRDHNQDSRTLGDPDPAELKELLAAIDVLFDGVQEDFSSIVDWAYTIDHLRCIPMLDQTDQWLSSHGTEPGYIRKLLFDLHKKIKLSFFKYVDEVNSQIEKHDRAARGRVGEQAGVLTFIPQFMNLATKMEKLIEDGSREMVDLAYSKLVNTMFSVLERIAQMDPKNADVLLLENFAAFQNSTYELAGPLPTLRKYYQQASEAYELACTKYIDGTINAQFDQLFVYRQKIKSLLVTVETEEIPFQVGLTKLEFRKMLKAQLTTPDKSLQAMYQRMKRTLTTGDLLPSLWEKCKEEFMERYEDLESLAEKCYNEVMTPTSEEMRDLFEEAVV